MFCCPVVLCGACSYRLAVSGTGFGQLKFAGARCPEPQTLHPKTEALYSPNALMVLPSGMAEPSEHVRR